MKEEKAGRDLSKKHILDSALKVIGEEGIASLTHRSVAKKANVAHSTVSYYFRTVDDILVNSFISMMDDLESRAEEIGLAIVEKKGKLTAKELFEIGARQAKEHYDSGYLLKAKYELILYAASNTALSRVYAKYADLNAKGLERFLKNMGYKKIDGRMLAYMLSGYELNALVDKKVNMSDIAEFALELTKKYK